VPLRLIAHDMVVSRKEEKAAEKRYRMKFMIRETRSDG
jgi:hypothetical protein